MNAEFTGQRLGVDVCCMADLHTDFDTFLRATQGRKVDMTLIAGDLTNAGTGDRAGVSRMREFLEEVVRRTTGPVGVVWGNHDLGLGPHHLPEGVTLLTRHPVSLAGLRVTGEALTCSFSNPANASHWRDMTACRITDRRRWASHEEPAEVVVAHSPPWGVLDTNGDGENVGSPGLLNWIHACRPRLVVCGHVHSCGMRTGVGPGGTVVLNVAQAFAVVRLGAEGVEVLEMGNLKHEIHRDRDRSRMSHMMGLEEDLSLNPCGPIDDDEDEGP